MSGQRRSAGRVEDAERYLLGLELFGMRFGLDRMRRLMTALDQPERRFDSIHVVGTNGKSSTARMIAAILERHGLRTGAYLSPHLVSFTERIRVDDADVEPRALRARRRARRARRGAGRPHAADDDRVTQFEALTAAAFSELAAREVDVAVIEAGLGGRCDATNVLPSTVQVLTNVGLEHTRWLGPTVARHRAREARRRARRRRRSSSAPTCIPTRWRRRARRPSATARGSSQAPADPGVELAAPGAFQRRNFALARAAAEAYLGDAGRALDAERVRAAAAAVTVPGRLQVVAHEPLTVLDGAHNADGHRRARRVAAGARRPAAGSSRSSRSSTTRTPPGCCARCCRTCERRRLHAQPNPRALPPATLASLCAQLGGAARASWRRDPRARSRAPASWPAPAASCSRPARSTSSPTCCAPAGRAAPRPVNARWTDGPRFLPMIALVAVVVALVILVFFAIGYAFGRLFL